MDAYRYDIWMHQAGTEEQLAKSRSTEAVREHDFNGTRNAVISPCRQIDETITDQENLSSCEDDCLGSSGLACDDKAVTSPPELVLLQA